MNKTFEVSYGFRLNKNCHDALKALELAVIKGGINYILDIDIRYFDNMNHKWLKRMLEGTNSRSDSVTTNREMAKSGDSGRG
ncbi:MAG: hypothetical protein MRK02_04280 [Candidatus Scalindua sp.]|nr:hypothetical protein [Candidatus Scalindua sp.]